MTITETLYIRETRYGSFANHATIAQALKHIMRREEKWHELSNHQKEALEMIAHKIARILNGDPNYIDSWHDIAGYATLVEQELEKIHDHTENITRILE